ncbi:unnamed protein product [Calypogeia fissa]
MEEAAFAMKGRQGNLLLTVFTLVLVALSSVCYASEGDRHAHFRSCTEKCEKTGFVNKLQVLACKDLAGGLSPNFEKSQELSLSVVFEEWDCRSECRYHCMKDTESKRELVSEAPMKYYGKWPFTRYLSLQEPASVIFSVLNLFAHLQGLLSFYRLVYYKLPRRVSTKAPYYEYTVLWIVYAALTMNSWFWSALFHKRDVNMTERLDYSSAIAFLGYSLVSTVIRVGNLRVEAAQVMAAAPILAFTATHIMYLNFYHFDYGLNMKVCIVMGVTQLLLWTGWAGITRHPSRFKLWCVVLGTVLSMLLEIFDFPPFWGVLDAHALWHACTVPITVFWWRFVKEDASFMTAVQQRQLDTDERKVK